MAEALRELGKDRTIFVEGHASPDPEVVAHCPFCGSGNVFARSDGNVECQMCTRQFTVAEQPTHSALPGTPGPDMKGADDPGAPTPPGADGATADPTDPAAAGADPAAADTGAPGTPDAPPKPDPTAAATAPTFTPPGAAPADSDQPDDDTAPAASKPDDDEDKDNPFAKKSSYDDDDSDLCVTCGYWKATDGDQCEACASDSQKRKKKTALRTATGAVLDEKAYVLHLALQLDPGVREAVLADRS